MEDEMRAVDPDRLAATVELGRRFVQAIVDHDWDAVAGCFEPGARFLAAIPNDTRPLREETGGDGAARQIKAWFGDADVTELVASEVEPMVDRVRIMYRIHEHEPDGWYTVEQMAYVAPGPEGFARMTLACSGFRPIDT